MFRVWRQPSSLSAAIRHSRSFSSSAESKSTHFGFRQVPLSDKQRLVTSVFSSVAPNYDIMNDLMSMGIHRLWKDAFVSDMAPAPGMQILDCAGGTGDIAFRIAKACNNCNVTVCDINEEMLTVGRSRSSNPQVTFLNGDAQELPLEDSSFDVYCISFGMRNVPRPELALDEALRILKPGGRFMMLEFAKVDSMPISQVYDAWSFNVIPAIGRYIAQDEPAYRYLVESIRQFPAQEEFLTMIRKAGFSDASATNYTFGIAACYSGFKPP